ncbi:S9 family peptidase [Sphingomonas sp. 1P06PA]|uniref:dipeptidyl-peptidase 5 n=1 Tax=Sphingomonas sp. 1P06PA TaxID=554121 RepID=UPI0039A6F6BC
MMLLRCASLLAIACAAPAVAAPLTPEILAGLSRVSAPVVSPDGRWLVWQQRETDLAANRGRTDLWALDLKARAAAPRKLAAEAEANESDPAFAPDGSVWYLSDKGGDAEVWRVAIDGSGAAPVTSGKRGISGFLIAPKGDRLLVWADRKPGAPSLEPAMVKPDPNAGSARTYDQLFIRHWDTWANGDRSQLFVLPVSGGTASGDGTALVGSLVGDTPSEPMGGAEELAWGADGATVYFTLREAGRIEPTSTNMDIFAVPAAGGAAPQNLTADNDATDSLPVASPDGRWLAYAAMERPTYEADRLGLRLRDLRTGQVRRLADDWDVSVASIAWTPDGKALLVTARDNFDQPLFRVDIATGRRTRLTKEGSVSAVAPLADGGAIVAIDSVTAPADLYRVSARGKLARLTRVNADRLAGIDMPQATKFSYSGAGGDTVWGYALKPAGLAAGQKAPVAYIVHGGPQSTLGNGWSYRWNPAVFAGAGYAAVFVDFHGSVGHGQAFTDSINKDWGGKPLDDLKLGLTAAGQKFAWADTSNACALGGSYGGYMMNWIAGQWNDGFKCLVNHAGVFDARAMAYETEELWFDEWEHGGPYFEQSAEYEKWNPVNHVTNWQTPMLVLHGEKDFRIPYTQGIAAFTALQRRQIPSRLVMFPDENHWILKPKNSLQWYREVFAWMGRWTAPQATK